MRLRKILVALAAIDACMLGALVVFGIHTTTTDAALVFAAEAAEMEMPTGPSRMASPIEGVYEKACGDATCRVILLDREYGATIMVSVLRETEPGAFPFCYGNGRFFHSDGSLLAETEGGGGVATIVPDGGSTLDVTAVSGFCEGFATSGRYRRV